MITNITTTAGQDIFRTVRAVAQATKMKIWL
jgi:hypothetical protein